MAAKEHILDPRTLESQISLWNWPQVNISSEFLLMSDLKKMLRKIAWKSCFVPVHPFSQWKQRNFDIVYQIPIRDVSVCIIHTMKKRNMMKICLEYILGFDWLLPLMLWEWIKRHASVREAVPVIDVVGVLKLVPII